MCLISWLHGLYHYPGGLRWSNALLTPTAPLAARPRGGTCKQGWQPYLYKSGICQMPEANGVRQACGPTADTVKGPICRHCRTAILEAGALQIVLPHKFCFDRARSVVGRLLCFGDSQMTTAPPVQLYVESNKLVI